MSNAIEYRREEIVPIPAQCTGKRPYRNPWNGKRMQGRHDWTGKDAINAPSLINCLCFWCGSPLIPHPDFPPVIDAVTRRKMHQADRVAIVDDAPYEQIALVAP